MIVFQTFTAFGAFFGVDNVGIFALGYRPSLADVKTAAALNAEFGNFVRHAKFPLKRKDARG